MTTFAHLNMRLGLCFTALILLLLNSSCRKADIFLSGEGSLEFTKDTIYFDTVFTRLPGSAYPKSVTKRFMVLNPYKESVRFNARIMNGSSSSYRMNIDGLTGRYIRDIEILPKDSAWVFVEATLEANNLTNPALVRDSIEFETNGNKQYIQLAAYGWDAYYLKDTVFKGNTNLVLNNKPYVIVNTAFVDENATLTIGPGIQFYCSPNSVVYDNGKQITVGALNVFGTLKVNGTKDNPVVFQGDRLGIDFQNKPGQWWGLHFWRGSINNEIKHAIIKNAIVGIVVDSLPKSGTFNLQLRNTIIKNISAYGILGRTAKLYLENSAISGCGLNTFVGYYGGDYTLIHCSLYTGANGRKEGHVLFNNALRDDNKVLIRSYDLKYAIVNSIIWGPLDSEIGFDLVAPPNPPVIGAINYCIYKSKVSLGGSGNKWHADGKTYDPVFVDAGNNNLKIKSESPAKDSADPNNSPPGDLEDNARGALPDMGAYEL